MIQLKSHFSNRIIKKGDEFSIYIDITNGNDEPIVLTDVTISQPMGFSPVTQETQAKANLPLLTKARFYSRAFYYVITGTRPKKMGKRLNLTSLTLMLNPLIILIKLAVLKEYRARV